MTQKRFRSHALRIHPFCRWCQCPLDWGSATTDHLVPLSRGGTNDRENVCLACQPCNRKRQNRLPGEPPPPGRTGGRAADVGRLDPLPRRTVAAHVPGEVLGGAAQEGEEIGRRNRRGGHSA